ncbi:MAG: protein kinase [Candidatus Coatesbacteria bacterium]|nr:protein kinase [Candidatus Coatesbacteria bacterium]
MIGKWVGSYEVKGLIGEGSSAIVYRAVQPSLGRPVAVKKLKLFETSDASLRERFRVEALAQSKLSHPNIVVIYDFVRQYDSYFIILEMLKRRSLRERIAEGGPIAPDSLPSMFLQILEAVASAHQTGVLHGDIRPSNVFLDEENGLKVGDFGQSRIVGGTAMLTATSVSGRVRYLSPEEIKREPMDVRSDIYSLGALLFEMATGQPPFSGNSAFEIMERHVKETAPAPRSIVERIPQVIEDTIVKAMQKSPEERFQSVKEMAAFIVGDATYAEVVRLNKRAFTLYNEGNYHSAMAIWLQVLKLDPDNAKAQGGISRAQLHIGEPEGKGLFETALEATQAKPAGRGEVKGAPASILAKPGGTVRGALSVLARAARSPRTLQREPLLMFLLMLMLGVVLLSGYLILELIGQEKPGGIRLASKVPDELLEPRLDVGSAVGLDVSAPTDVERSVKSDRQVLAKELAAEGKALCDRGEGRKALVKFEKATELARGELPELAKDYSNCCVKIGVDTMQNDPDTALEFFRKAIQIYPDSHEAYLQAGRIHSRERDYQRAISDYRKALSIEPDLPLAHFNLGHAYLLLSSYSEAADEFKIVIGSGSSLVCEAYLNLGVTYHKKGDLHQALEVFSEGVKACPNSAELKKKRDQVEGQLRDASGKRRR